MTPKRGEPHGRVWLAVAVGLFALGSIGSVIGANAVGHADGQRSRQAFASTSTDIALILQRSLEHQQDLYFSAAGFVAGNEDASEEQFKNLGRSDTRVRSIPGVRGDHRAGDGPRFRAGGVRRSRRRRSTRPASSKWFSCRHSLRESSVLLP